MHTRLAVLALLSIPSTCLAETPPLGPHAINLNVPGLILGDYTANYERLIGSHGVVLALGYSRLGSAAPFGEAGEASLTRFTGALGYRWHPSESHRGGFLGAQLAASRGEGEAPLDGGRLAVGLDTLEITANAGYRWVWSSGLCATLRVGGGYAPSWRRLGGEARAEEAGDAVEALLPFAPWTIEGEASIGWVF